MMAQEMTGLFGPYPYEIQQQRNASMNDFATQMSRMNASERGTYALSKGGGMLGGMAANAMGMVDPAVELAKRNQQELAGLDTQTPESILKTAQQVTDPRIKFQLMELAQKRKKEISDEALTKAHAAYYEREKADPKEIMMLEIANDPTKPDEMRKMAADWLAKNGSGASKGGTGRTQSINTSAGILTFDPYSKIYTYADGSTVPSDILREMKPIGNDPLNAVAVATAKAGGAAVGKSAGEAMAQLPKIDNDITLVNDLGTKLFNHPGYKSLVGAGFPGLKYLQGSAVPGAKAFVDQLNGIGYLMAREELRGQGQVTEGEANAATAAFNRMNTATSEKDFKDAYDDFVKRVENVRNILRTRAGMTFDQRKYQLSQSSPATAAPTAPTSGTAQTNSSLTQKPFKETITSEAQAYDLYQKGILTKESANKIIQEIKTFGVKR